MKTMLANQQTKEQIALNENVRFQFVLGVASMDEKVILPLLKENGIFFGDKNRWQAAKWFRAIFSKVTFPFYTTSHKQGVSLERYPGSEAHEFAFIPLCISEPDSDDLGFEANPSKSENPVTLRLVIAFENGKISDIRTVLNIVPFEQVTKLQTNN